LKTIVYILISNILDNWQKSRSTITIPSKPQKGKSFHWRRNNQLNCYENLPEQIENAWLARVIGVDVIPMEPTLCGIFRLQRED